MKKSLILFAMMIVLGVSCNGLQKDRNKTDETEQENPIMNNDTQENDIFEESNDSITVGSDSIGF